MESAIVYGSMIASSIFFAIRAKISNCRVYLLCIVLVLTFVCGCRAYSVGNDTQGYFDIYESILKNGVNPYSEMEPGYEYLCRGILLILPHPQAVFILVALITYSLITWRFWELRDIAEFDWAIACFTISFHFFIQSGMRQSLALAVVFWTMRYLEKKKILSYLIGVTIAYTIHRSAMVAFVNIFCLLPLWKKLSVKKQLSLLLCILAIPIGLLIAMRYYAWGRYIDLFEANFEIGLRVFAEIGFALLSIIAFGYTDTAKSSMPIPAVSTRYRTGMIRLYYVLGLLIGTLGYISSTLGRMQMYWYWYQPVLMGMLARSKCNRAILRSLIILFMIYLCISSITGNGYSQVPYLFFWQV